MNIDINHVVAHPDQYLNVEAVSLLAKTIKSKIPDRHILSKEALLAERLEKAFTCCLTNLDVRTVSIVSQPPQVCADTHHRNPGHYTYGMLRVVQLAYVVYIDDRTEVIVLDPAKLWPFETMPTVRSALVVSGGTAVDVDYIRDQTATFYTTIDPADMDAIKQEYRLLTVITGSDEWDIAAVRKLFERWVEDSVDREADGSYEQYTTDEQWKGWVGMYGWLKDHHIDVNGLEGL